MEVISSPQPSHHQSLPGWIAIAGVAIIATLGALVGAGSLVRLFFPAASLVVAIFLYFRYPLLYVGFAWWVWFLTPLLRRVSDYNSFWDEKGIILLTPYLVTFVSVLTLVRHLPRTQKMGGLPFVLAIASVVYAFFIGLVLDNPPIAAVRSFLDWICPILFGFHLFANWRDYPSYRHNLQRVFLWCVLITGLYGIYQFMVAPAWDCFWLIRTKLVSFGKPEPFEIRVWSTMHSPGPFAVVMMAGLLLLFSERSLLGIPAAMGGYLAILISMVRSAWGGWVAGLLASFASTTPKYQMRLVVTILVLVLCVTPLTAMEPFDDVISERVESISNLARDQSFRDRSDNYDRDFNVALTRGLGRGMGSTWIVNERNGKLEMIVLDSAILDIFFTLGWAGALPYLGGLIFLLISLFKDAAARADPFASAARGIALAVFFQFIFSSVMLGLSGMILWGFMGIALAASRYHRHRKGLLKVV
ncbi:MAG: hypothetical protein Fur0046_04290 [Cyanobacteria bacterium J069]|nr:MAG: O-antigen ligase domain-containing protein [Cyanobacteria bacterium J069]